MIDSQEGTNGLKHSLLSQRLHKMLHSFSSTSLHDCPLLLQRLHMSLHTSLIVSMAPYPKDNYNKTWVEPPPRMKKVSSLDGGKGRSFSSICFLNFIQYSISPSVIDFARVSSREIF